MLPPMDLYMPFNIILIQIIFSNNKETFKIFIKKCDYQLKMGK